MQNVVENILEIRKNIDDVSVENVTDNDRKREFYKKNNISISNVSAFIRFPKRKGELSQNDTWTQKIY